MSKKWEDYHKKANEILKLFIALSDININLLDKFEFTKDNFNKINNKDSGIYFFFDKYRELIYVGSSKTLRKRLLSHINGQSHKEIPTKYFSYILLEEEYIRLVESYFITLYKPNYNNAILVF